MALWQTIHHQTILFKIEHEDGWDARIGFPRLAIYYDIRYYNTLSINET